MSTTTTPLKYKFVAIYKDESVFQQPDNDRSKDYIEGAEWNPSAFRDVDLDNLRYFGIESPENSVAVDIETGRFNVNGAWIELHDQGDVLGKLKLIYFREMKRDIIGGDWQEPFVSKYYIGWETTTGKKIKRTIGIE